MLSSVSAKRVCTARELLSALESSLCDRVGVRNSSSSVGEGNGTAAAGGGTHLVITELDFVLDAPFDGGACGGFEVPAGCAVSSGRWARRRSDRVGRERRGAWLEPGYLHSPVGVGAPVDGGDGV